MLSPEMSEPNAQLVCSLEDLVPNSGVAVLCSGQQIALFYLPDQPNKVHAISNYDPLGKANVLSRGIVGDKGGQPVVASPLYKQHFNLLTGVCVEDPSVSVPTFKATLEDNQVMLQI